MAFRKQNNRENENTNPYQPKNHMFSVSNSSYNKAAAVSSLSVSLVLILIFIVRDYFTIEHSDIQTLCQITAEISGLSLAIPLFLKDFKVDSNFWKHFFLISVTFLVSTFIGVYLFLKSSENHGEEIQLTIVLLFSFIFTVNIHTIRIFWEGRKRNKRKFDFSFTNRYTFTIILLLMIVTMVVSQGDRVITSFIVSCIYGFILVFTLILSVIFEILNPRKIISLELKIKKAIEEEIKTNKQIAYSEQMLIDNLRKKHFPSNQEVISRTQIQELVSEMDSENDEQLPKLTICEYDKIIPRWEKSYDLILMNAQPKGICIYKYSNEKISIKEFNNEFIDQLYNELSNSSQLSAELLRDNNSVFLKFDKFIHYGGHLYGFQIEEFNRIKNFKPKSINDVINFVNNLSSTILGTFNITYSYSYSNSSREGILTHLLISEFGLDIFFGKKINQSQLLDLIGSNPDQGINFYSTKLLSELGSMEKIDLKNGIQRVLFGRYSALVQTIMEELEAANKVEKYRHLGDGEIKWELKRMHNKP